MGQFLSVAPGALWAAIILGLSAGATLLADYFGAEVPAWVPALILTVIVPMLKVLATNEPPATRANGEIGTPQRSKVSRWLW
jgi:L-asparagine transporter-like permease